MVDLDDEFMKTLRQVCEGHSVYITRISAISIVLRNYIKDQTHCITDNQYCDNIHPVSQQRGYNSVAD